MKENEFIRYIIWGVLSTVLNIGLFEILENTMDYRMANIITLVVVKLFCYVTNKLFVFKTHCENLKELLKEICTFLIARTFTFFVDFFGLIVMVEVFMLDSFIGKCVMSVIVIVMNYILSKKCVFRCKR